MAFVVEKKWNDAMKIRVSRRSYDSRTVEARKMEALSTLARSINELGRGVRIEVIEGDTSGIFRGIVGGYGKITSTGQYAAFIGDSADPDAERLLGYYGEAFILEATSLGVGTCWVSGTFNPESVKAHISLRPGEEVFSVTPLGYPTEDSSPVERLAKFVVRSEKRKPSASILDGDLSAIPNWAQAALNSARSAPSATNRQPWLFKWTKDSMTIRVRGTGKRLIQDCGIAMLHFALGALESGIAGKWEAGTDSVVAIFKPD
ncbi:MAG: hypothetical protein A2Z99_01165 [Treponema sp. GWB1_62_6]|nr:MAG: hypothetical protein A2Y36_05855 [Treponema sp. GWA1_62_8]OHE64068.1 MAG: hypothetical protein A2Z99_01165 [Treponema sp. GWB1_62_6]OHE69001.1 MAG: hypothetical protein A2001_18335 [Treponema sp. GWC1_61_84]OHE69961.1 MAG: hypothetical protein A2413_00875 [Treponema sp. RIFOXYC1_FULL_61_9]HCM28506.1 nitroreductase [Treponema sp.]